MFNVRNDNNKFDSIAEYERTLKELYEVARESMNTRQAIAATYYDKKVLDDELKVDELVFVFAPRNKSKKLSLKWFGPHRVIQCKHPAYEIEKAWTRDKLKRAPPNSHVIQEEQKEIEQPQTLIETEVIESSDSDSDDGQPGLVNRNGGRYQLRPNPPRVQFLNDVYIHSIFIRNFYS